MTSTKKFETSLANRGLTSANGEPAPQFTKRGELKSFKAAVDEAIKRRKLNYQRQ